MTDGTLQTLTLAGQIRERLVARMIAGDLQPGDRLIEMRIAKEMGTSQAPVREALRELEGLGLVQFRRNRGAIVREVSDKERQEIYTVRAELEGHAAARVAAGQPQLAEALASLCAQMEQDAAADPETFARLNTAFHRTIVEGAGNGTLLRIWEGLDIQLRTALNTARNPQNIDTARRDHRQITTAIAKGDAAGARTLMVAHITGVAS